MVMIMDYKERYEMVLETIQEILDSGSESIKMSRLRLRLQSVFPELKESEDERIRKDIIAIFKGQIPYTSEEDAKKYIAWLEKQGEQKSMWTEEDESKVEDIIYFLNTAKTHYASTKALDDCIDWLKSLKQRMEQ